MTETEIRAFLFDILENMFEIDTGNVTGSTNLYEDLEIDSIDAIDLLDQIKRQTGYKLQAEDFRNVRTIDDIIAAYPSSTKTPSPKRENRRQNPARHLERTLPPCCGITAASRAGFIRWPASCSYFGSPAPPCSEIPASGAFPCLWPPFSPPSSFSDGLTACIGIPYG